MYGFSIVEVRWPERLFDLLFEWTKENEHTRALWVLETQKGKVVCGVIEQTQKRGIG